MTRRSIGRRAAVVTATALITAGTIGVGVGVSQDGPEKATKPTKAQIASLYFADGRGPGPRAVT